MYDLAPSDALGAPKRCATYSTRVLTIENVPFTHWELRPDRHRSPL